MQKLLIFQITRFFIKSICHIYFRIEIDGVENVPKTGAMIIAPNHASYMDPLWVSVAITRPLRYMTWERIIRLPLLGPLIRFYGAFPVKLDRGDRFALRQSAEQLKSGGGLVIFPEGTRTFTGRLNSFKPGVIRLAIDTDVPIVPVTIIGGYRAFSPHHLFPRPYKLRVVYHPPIHLTPPDDEAFSKAFMREQAQRIQGIVASVLPPESLPPVAETIHEA